MVLFQPADLMRLERKERRLEPGEESGAVDQDRNRKKEKDENASVIFRYGGGGATACPSKNSSMLVCRSSQAR